MSKKKQKVIRPWTLDVGALSAADRATLLARFESLYIPEPNSGCWLWLGTETRATLTYGVIHYRQHACRAHRVSYELFCGPIPAGELVRHKCDTPLCVNPDHLVLGSYYDNNRDCHARGRFVARGGEKHHASKLTNHAVAEMRALYASGATTFQALAERYSVSDVAVRMAVRGQTWTHVAGAVAP